MPNFQWTGRVVSMVLGVRLIRRTRIAWLSSSHAQFSSHRQGPFHDKGGACEPVRPNIAAFFLPRSSCPQAMSIEYFCEYESRERRLPGGCVTVKAAAHPHAILAGQVKSRRARIHTCGVCQARA
ncbi:hypothetical protein FVE85_2364 [Porphyridium purpureum]|uniref:Uncharacterized protein n=1 Tax=Porphyridium purpureum TaxID=35688 RepID=A0A5J4YXA2_PORPP|nr:hypothetical protein FVE85_2364 [Porphyridium purpureum]|eukprot:POR3486..scf209_3